jgi:hypothetical protein
MTLFSNIKWRPFPSFWRGNTRSSAISWRMRESLTPCFSANSAMLYSFKIASNRCLWCGETRSRVTPHLSVKVMIYLLVTSMKVGKGKPRLWSHHCQRSLTPGAFSGFMRPSIPLVPALRSPGCSARRSPPGSAPGTRHPSELRV